MPSSAYVVAVIDDDDFIREALHTVLPAFNCKVELYDSADAFRAALATTAANCLMIDVHLGTVFGISFGRELLNAGLTLPIVFMSGSSDDSVRAQALEIGVAFLNKPFSPEELAQVLDAARRRGPRKR